MADRAIENAKKERDKVAAEINREMQRVEDLKKELARIDTFIEDWHRFADPLEQLEISLGDVLADAPRTRPKNPDRKDVGRAAYAIIQERGHPIPRKELFNALVARGITLQGKDPEMVLSTMMWRMQDVFIRLPGRGYWIKHFPYKPAGYLPGQEVLADAEDNEILEYIKNAGDDLDA